MSVTPELVLEAKLSSVDFSAGQVMGRAGHLPRSRKPDPGRPVKVTIQLAISQLRKL